MNIPGLIVNDSLVDEGKIVWLHDNLTNVATYFSSEMTSTFHFFTDTNTFSLNIAFHSKIQV